jgi:hypothetical protein
VSDGVDAMQHWLSHCMWCQMPWHGTLLRCRGPTCCCCTCCAQGVPTSCKHAVQSMHPSEANKPTMCVPSLPAMPCVLTLPTAPTGASTPKYSNSASSSSSSLSTSGGASNADHDFPDRPPERETGAIPKATKVSHIYYAVSTTGAAPSMTHFAQ